MDSPPPPHLLENILAALREGRLRAIAEQQDAQARLNWSVEELATHEAWLVMLRRRAELNRREHQVATRTVADFDELIADVERRIAAGHREDSSSSGDDDDDNDHHHPAPDRPAPDHPADDNDDHRPVPDHPADDDNNRGEYQLMFSLLLFLSYFLFPGQPVYSPFSLSRMSLALFPIKLPQFLGTFGLDFMLIL